MATSPDSTSVLTPRNLGFLSALASVQKDPTATQVQILWFTICASLFPSQEGYKIAIRSANKGSTQLVQITEVHVRPTGSNPPNTAADLVERPIFCVLCKAGRADRSEEWPSESIWEGECGLGDRGFRAVARGTTVMFYMFPTAQDALSEHLHLDILDLCREAQHVEHHLLDIKRQAWDWAGDDSILPLLARLVV